MKKYKCALACFLAAALAAGSMSADVGAAAAKKGMVKSVTITKPEAKTLIMKKGDTFQLKAKIKTSGKADKSLVFLSSNTKIAAVSAKGKIKALKKGEATITVKSKADKKKKAVLKVVVKIPVSGVTLDKTALELTEGETAKITATVSPKNATVKKVNFVSDNTEAVSVNAKGEVTAMKEGTATITASAKDNKKKKAVCVVNVKKKAEESKEPETPDESTKPEESTKPTESETPDESVKPTEPVYPGTIIPNPITPPEPTTPENPDKPETPSEEDKLSYEGYELKWKDEFDGASLNRDDWNVELHEPGWVNAEWQEYVDSEENIYVKDGNLVIKPVKKTVDGKDVYTSGRVNTQGKHDFTYGLFETRVKVPTGKGYLPAFWMMPTDENRYGQWPRCGEIDIMEVMGDNTKKAYGTIHYGNPHGQAQGTKVLENGDYSSEYHTYAVEWEPGKITWYIDGVKFHEANDWYSITEGQGTVAYPAPFDQPFYMILNLAIGGSWVGYPDESTTYEDQAFIIDYVKAYQKSGDYYEKLEASVEKPKKPEVVEPADNVYVKNGNFAGKDDLTGKDGSVWEFMTAKGGKAQASVVKDETFGTGASAVRISTENAGTEDYAVQFVQADIPVKQGGKYKVSFDAYAASDRTIIVDVSAPDYNYARYLNDTTAALTTSKQTYSYEFTVTDHDDANARLEFNLGKTDPISDVFISNIKMEKIGAVEIDTSKKVLTDGNYVSNGKFQEGTEKGKKYLQDWDIVDAGEKASYGVTGVLDGRKFRITTKDCKSADEVVLKQTGLPLTAGKFALSFDAGLDTTKEETKTITVKAAGHEKTFDITKDMTNYLFKFEIEDTEIADNKIEFFLGVNDAVLLDNVRLVEDTLIKNGSFLADLAGFEVYAYTPGNVEYTVDSQKEDKAFAITIKNTGSEDWHIQLKQNNVELEKDQWYKLKFDIKSSEDRKVSYAIQRNGSVHKDDKGNEDWTPYVQDVILVNSAYQTVDVDFKMNYDTDDGSIFNIAMGAVGGEVLEKPHSICIDNISLEKIDEPEDVFPDIPAGTNLLQNADFSKGLDGWVETIANWGGEFVADAESTVSENAVTYTIQNTGTEDWHVQLKQNDVPLQKGKTYVLTFDVVSSQERKIHYAVQKNGDKNGGDWTPYKEADVDLTETKQTVVEEFTMPENDKYAALSFSLGKIKGQQITEEHTVTISNISLAEKA